MLARSEEEYKVRWAQVCEDLDTVSKAVSGKTTILFHCFAGVNRSSSALCAFLILRKHLTAEQAVRALVEARPGQQYWKDRDYFVDGLLDIQAP